MCLSDKLFAADIIILMLSFFTLKILQKNLYPESWDFRSTSRTQHTNQKGLCVSKTQVLL